MAKYATKQRQALLEFLLEHADERLSIKQISDGLAGAGVSLSAVYRNLSELEAEGKVKRYTKFGARDAQYQYIAAPSCVGHLHLSCSKCGKTFHMQSAEANALVTHVANSEGFFIDKSDTVLYGVCKDCK